MSPARFVLLGCVHSIKTSGGRPAFGLNSPPRLDHGPPQKPTMVGNVSINSDLIDINNDGILELVHTREDGRGFDIFKLSGQDYKFFDVVDHDPNGPVDASGNLLFVRAFCTRLEPHRFSFGAIREAQRDRDMTRDDGHDREQGVIKASFGALRELDGSPVDVNDIDVDTIAVSPHIIPRRVSIDAGHRHDDDQHAEGQHDEDRKDGAGCEFATPQVTIQLSRLSVLRALQTLQFDGPLKPGNRIAMALSARLKNGTPVSAVFEASIVGGHDRDEDDADEDHK